MLSLPVVSFSVLSLVPRTSHILRDKAKPSYQLFPIAFISAVVAETHVLRTSTSGKWTDIVVALLLYIGQSNLSFASSKFANCIRKSCILSIVHPYCIT